MAVTLTYKTKEGKLNSGSILEFIRLKDDIYPFDEVHVKGVNFKNLGSESGVEIMFDYERLGNTIRNMRPLEAPLKEFAQMRQIKQAGGDVSSADIVKRLFAWACAEYNQMHKAIEADLVEEIAFLSELGNGNN